MLHLVQTYRFKTKKDMLFTKLVADLWGLHTLNPKSVVVDWAKSPNYKNTCKCFEKLKLTRFHILTQVYAMPSKKVKRKKKSCFLVGNIFFQSWESIPTVLHENILITVQISGFFFLRKSTDMALIYCFCLSE